MTARRSRCAPPRRAGSRPRTSTPGERIHIAIAVERPGWAKRLVGAIEHTSIIVTAPRARVLTHWIQTRPGKPVQVRFSTPVRSVTVMRGDKVAKQRLARPRRVVSLPSSLTSSDSGSVRVSAAARTWESSSSPVRVTWFPTGSPLPRCCSRRSARRSCPSSR